MMKFIFVISMTLSIIFLMFSIKAFNASKNTKKNSVQILFPFWCFIYKKEDVYAYQNSLIGRYILGLLILSLFLLMYI